MRIGNFVIFEKNIKKLSALISGYRSTEDEKNSKSIEGDINIGTDLYASTRIGKERDNQEDAVAIMKFPTNEKYKMLVVADGVGGNEDGEKASHMTVTEIREWFNTLEVADFADEEVLITKLVQKLNSINKQICTTTYDAATTFVCAIIGKNNTVIVNVGDSRAYLVNGSKLKQISTDDSIAQILYENGNIKTRDDIRFHKRGNVITESIGQREVVEPNVKIIPNNSYDAILLFSDGVTDCLSDNQIYAITNQTSHKELAKAIVNNALNTDSKRAKRGDKTDSAYYEEIKGGKDNTTAAVYINKTKGKSR